jgi:hypothetical protein
MVYQARKRLVSHDNISMGERASNNNKEGEQLSRMLKLFVSKAGGESKPEE